MKKQLNKDDISKLLEIMRALRDPDSGCPWDLEQDFASIAPYTIEEAYEVADVIERDALAELPGELGDLLLQVVFHAQMAAEQGLFDFGDVVAAICEKMVRRHPHVFGDESASTPDQVMESWDRIKRSEKPAGRTLMDGVGRGLPALSRARKIGKRAASVGFDWPDAAPVRGKLDEELAELDQALADSNQSEVEAEIGDLLFTVVNLGRHLGIDAEEALRKANDRFIGRFDRVEAAVTSAGGDWADFDSDALEAHWERAKQSS